MADLIEALELVAREAADHRTLAEKSGTFGPTSAASLVKEWCEGRVASLTAERRRIRAQHIAIGTVIAIHVDWGSASEDWLADLGEAAIKAVRDA